MNVPEAELLDKPLQHNLERMQCSMPAKHAHKNQ
jgi:hypothetical protein